MTAFVVAMESQSTQLNEKTINKNTVFFNDWHILEPSLSLLSCLLNASHSPSHLTYNLCKEPYC